MRNADHELFPMADCRRSRMASHLRSCLDPFKSQYSDGRSVDAPELRSALACHDHTTRDTADGGTMNDMKKRLLTSLRFSADDGQGMSLSADEVIFVLEMLETLDAPSIEESLKGIGRLLE